MADTNVAVILRRMILKGELASGEPMLEAVLAERLNVSRTPIRNALPALAAEGLLEPRGQRGFSVKGFTRQDSVDGLEIRSALEGIAARRVAQAGPSPALLATLQDCLDALDTLFLRGTLTLEDEQTYSQYNSQFHSAIIDAAGSPTLKAQIDRIDLIPFVAPAAIAFRGSDLKRTDALLRYSHQQHHAIVQALATRDATRAEFLFREHAFPQLEGMWDERLI